MIYTNRERLAQRIEQFSQLGRTANNGVTRLSLSAEDIAARNLFVSICKELGLVVTIDDLGNIYATLESKGTGKPIYSGSHLDSVVKGGRFDGVLGVLTALEAVQTIIDHQLDIAHPITIVNFTNEEGARFEPSMMSSGVLAGKFDIDTMKASTDSEGVTFGEALAESSYEGDIAHRLTEGHAYVELHIEQGPVLQTYEKEIGVVEGVLGMVCYDIAIKGESNHAGTTPIAMRKDSMFAAAHVMLQLQEQLKQLPDDLVYTIGRCNVSPNIHTVIPSDVVFSLEARHQDPAVIAKVEAIIRQLPAIVEQCDVSYEKLWSRDTVHFAPDVFNEVARSAQQLGYSTNRMYSGAGHDAQFVASLLPSAMIFVPSDKGYSHREDEFTSFEECSKGADVLVNTLLRLAGYDVAIEKDSEKAL